MTNQTKLNKSTIARAAKAGPVLAVANVEDVPTVAASVTVPAGAWWTNGYVAAPIGSAMPLFGDWTPTPGRYEFERSNVTHVPDSFAPNLTSIIEKQTSAEMASASLSRVGSTIAGVRNNGDWLYRLDRTNRFNGKELAPTFVRADFLHAVAGTDDAHDLAAFEFLQAVDAVMDPLLVVRVVTTSYVMQNPWRTEETTTRTLAGMVMPVRVEQ